MSGLPTRAQIIDYEKVFSFYDIFRNGLVETKHLGSILLFLNKKYTKDALREMMLDVDPDREGFFTCRKFIALMTRLMEKEYLHTKELKQEVDAGTSENRTAEEAGAMTSEERAKGEDAAGDSELHVKGEDTAGDLVLRDTAGDSEMFDKEEDATGYTEMRGIEEEFFY